MKRPPPLRAPEVEVYSSKEPRLFSQLLVFFRGDENEDPFAFGSGDSL